MCDCLNCFNAPTVFLCFQTNVARINKPAFYCEFFSMKTCTKHPLGRNLWKVG